MGNMINQMIKLADQRMYAIMKQAEFDGKQYYFAVEVDAQGNTTADRAVILEEKIEEGKVFVTLCADPMVLNELLNHFSA